MYDLNAIRIFVKVVENEGFTAAAEKLKLPKSKISRVVAKLEGELNTRLLERTTRHVRLTEAGQIFYQYCQRILSEADQAENALIAMNEHPSGLLRISTTHSIGQHLLAPQMASFIRQHPDIELDMVLSNRRVDLIEENFDAAIRAGNLPDSNLVSKRLGHASILMYASQSYIEQHGRPKDPTELTTHKLLGMSAALGRKSLRLQHIKTQKSMELSLKFPIKVDDFGVLHQLASDGCGITLLPHYMCQQASILTQILPEWRLEPAPFYLVYPSHRGATPKLRAFIDFLGKEISPILD